MKLASIWTDRWARIAALLIFGSTFVAFAIEMAPITAEVFDMITPAYTALAVLFWCVVAVVVLFPAWWALWRARRAGLPQPWVFAMVTWGFTTVFLESLAGIVMVPLLVFQVFFVPQLREDGVLPQAFGGVLHDVLEYWWIGLPLLQVIGAVVVTRVFAKRWHGIDRAVVEHQPV